MWRVQACISFLCLIWLITQINQSPWGWEKEDAELAGGHQGGERVREPLWTKLRHMPYLGKMLFQAEALMGSRMSTGPGGPKMQVRPLSTSIQNLVISALKTGLTLASPRFAELSNVKLVMVYTIKQENNTEMVEKTSIYWMQHWARPLSQHCLIYSHSDSCKVTKIGTGGWLALTHKANTQKSWDPHPGSPIPSNVRFFSSAQSHSQDTFFTEWGYSLRSIKKRCPKYIVQWKKGDRIVIQSILPLGLLREEIRIYTCIYI